MPKYRQTFNSFITSTYICNICGNNNDIQINKGIKFKQDKNIILWCYKCKKYTNHTSQNYIEKNKVLKLKK